MILKKQLTCLIFIAIGFLIPATIVAQKDTVINGMHYRTVKPKKVDVSPITGKRQIPLDSEFVINNKVFRYYNKWFTIGGGVQQNLSNDYKAGFTGGADFNFHIKRNYFQTGGEIMGEHFGYYTNYQVHAGYGFRIEDKDVHFSMFAGPSYSFGLAKVDTVYTRPYNDFGFYLQSEIVKKIAQDVGIGASIFIDWNQEQTIAGLRAILYFSGSYRGKKYHEVEEE